MNTPKEKQFQTLLEESKGSIYRICKSYLYDESQQEDLFQEIVLELWKSMDRFRHEAKWNTYIYRIALNTAIRYNLKHKRQKEISPQVVKSELYATEHGSSQVEKEEQLAQMHRCIQQLDSADRLIISLVLEDLSYKEIAEILESNVNHVGVKINRIKKKLLKLMENGSV